MAKLSDMLTYLRSREGVSQQELADRLKVSRSAIGMYETGKREPDLETLEAFKAKAATIKKGQYRGIDIIKSWMPEMAEYETCIYMKLQQAKPFFFGLDATLQEHFVYTDTNGLDTLTVR